MIGSRWVCTGSARRSLRTSVVTVGRSTFPSPKSSVTTHIVHGCVVDFVCADLVGAEVLVDHVVSPIAIFSDYTASSRCKVHPHQSLVQLRHNPRFSTGSVALKAWLAE